MICCAQCIGIKSKSSYPHLGSPFMLETTPMVLKHCSRRQASATLAPTFITRTCAVEAESFLKELASMQPSADPSLAALEPLTQWQCMPHFSKQKEAHAGKCRTIS